MLLSDTISIRLLLCNDLKSATKLSKELNCTVYANDGTTRIHSDGGITTLNKEGTAPAKWYEIKPDGTQVDCAFVEKTSVTEEFVELGWFGKNKKPEIYDIVNIKAEDIHIPEGLNLEQTVSYIAKEIRSATAGYSVPADFQLVRI